MVKKVLLLSGSARDDSFNGKLLAVVAEIISQKGGKATIVDLREYDMPIYDGDLEDKSGIPESAKKLEKVFGSHDAIVIASPEYNGLPTPLLINTIAWVSRLGLGCFADKHAAVVSASPGGLGGLRGLPHIRALLNNIGITVISQQLAISAVHNAFNDDGDLSDDKQKTVLEKVVSKLI